MAVLYFGQTFTRLGAEDIKVFRLIFWPLLNQSAAYPNPGNL